MKVFVAASYSSMADQKTGQALALYKEELENILDTVESYGHSVFCSLRADKYLINNDPAGAYKLDTEQISSADALIAILNKNVSSGVQTEIGYALALNKLVVLAHDSDSELSWFNRAIVKSAKAKEIILPIRSDPLN